MSGLTSSTKLIKGGLVVLDAATGGLEGMIALQYNADTFTRSYQVQGAGDTIRNISLNAAALAAHAEASKREHPLADTETRGGA